MRKANVCVAIVMLMTMLTWSQAALAQVDETLRNDVQQDLLSPPLDIQFLPLDATAPAPSLNLQLAGSVLHNSNAGFVPDNETSGTALLPRALLTYRHMRLFGALDFQADAEITGTYYSGNESDFDDGKAMIKLSLSRTNPEARRTWAIAYQGTAIYDGAFSARRLNLLEYGVSVTQNFTNTPNETVLAGRIAYGDGPRAARRWMVQVDFTHQFARFNLFKAKWRLSERLLYSDFEETTSPDGLLARTTFGPTWQAGGFEIGVNLIHAHNFSEAEDADVILFGPTISRRF